MNKAIFHFLSGRYGAKLELKILLRQTAKAFGEKTPKMKGLSAAEPLECYAAYTADAARRAIGDGQDLSGLRRRLFAMTARLGGRLRRLLEPKSERDCQAIIRMLYRNIGITIREESPGSFCVFACYFSAFYTPDVCKVISAVDQGIFAGIYGGGRLMFRERITEGSRECMADLKEDSFRAF